MMKLSEKGRFVPRPTLEGVAERVACSVESWPEVHARTHWELGDETIVDGADFYVGERELGHLHLYAEAHIVMPRSLRDALIAAKLARPFRWSESFVVHRVRTAADAEHVERLFRLAFDYLQGKRLPKLRAQVDAWVVASAPPRASGRSATASAR